MTTQQPVQSEPASPPQEDKRMSVTTVWVLSILFIVLMTVSYLKADVFLEWMESVIRALFL
jgi:hypothetical protein